MSWTKRQIIEQAFEEIGYASYAFDLETEQLEAGLRRLDSMIGVWNSREIKLGYPLPTNPGDSNLDDESNIPDYAIEAVYLNLAMRLGAVVGKAISPETKSSARSSYNEVCKRNALPLELKLPDRMPRGQGNKPWRYWDRFYHERDNVVTPPEQSVEFRP